MIHSHDKQSHGNKDGLERPEVVELTETENFYVPSFQSDDYEDLIGPFKLHPASHECFRLAPPEPPTAPTDFLRLLELATQDRQVYIQKEFVKKKDAPKHSWTLWDSIPPIPPQTQPTRLQRKNAALKERTLSPMQSLFFKQYPQ